jgi:hypothetical protein
MSTDNTSPEKIFLDEAAGAVKAVANAAESTGLWSRLSLAQKIGAGLCSGTLVFGGSAAGMKYAFAPKEEPAKTQAKEEKKEEKKPQQEEPPAIKQASFLSVDNEPEKKDPKKEPGVLPIDFDREMPIVHNNKSEAKGNEDLTIQIPTIKVGGSKESASKKGNDEEDLLNGLPPIGGGNKEPVLPAVPKTPDKAPVAIDPNFKPAVAETKPTTEKKPTLVIRTGAQEEKKPAAASEDLKLPDTPLTLPETPKTSAPPKPPEGLKGDLSIDLPKPPAGTKDLPKPPAPPSDLNFDLPATPGSKETPTIKIDAAIPGSKGTEPEMPAIPKVGGAATKPTLEIKPSTPGGLAGGLDMPPPPGNLLPAGGEKKDPPAPGGERKAPPTIELTPPPPLLGGPDKKSDTPSVIGNEGKKDLLDPLPSVSPLSITPGGGTNPTTMLPTPDKLAPTPKTPLEATPEPGRITPKPPTSPGNATAATSPPPENKKEDYDEDWYTPKSGDSYVTISREHYRSEDYAKALETYNRERRRTSGDNIIRIPPAWVLKEKYPNLVNTIEAKPRDEGVKNNNNIRFEPVGGELASRTSPRPAPPAAAPSNPPGLTPIATSPIRSNNDEYRVATPSGESIRDISQKLYGDPNQWRRIWELNSNLDPTQPIPEGTILRVGR